MKKLYQISGMDCPSCAMLIESELEDAGIRAKVSYAKQTLEVDNSKDTSADQVLKIVGDLGYKIEKY